MGRAGASLRTPPTATGSATGTNQPGVRGPRWRATWGGDGGPGMCERPGPWVALPDKAATATYRLRSLSWAGACGMGGQAPASPPASSPGLAGQIGPVRSQGHPLRLRPGSALGAHPLVTPPAWPPLALSLPRGGGMQAQQLLWVFSWKEHTQVGGAGVCIEKMFRGKFILLLSLVMMLFSMLKN